MRLVAFVLIMLLNFHETYTLIIMGTKHFCILIVFILYSHLSFAQFIDSFADGNFTANPAWAGNTALFTVVSGELRNNDTGAGNCYLSTPSTSITEWIFQVRLGFNPSSANFTRVYLMSSQADLTSTTLAGYYVELGRSGDDIDLVRQDNTSRTPIINGSGSLLANSSNNVRIKVIRSSAGEWTMTADLTGGNNFSTTIGTVTDNNHTTSAHAGVYCQYTSTRKDKIFFDNFEVAQPPSISTTNVLSTTQLDVTFSEDVDQTTAETTTNYSVNNSVGNPTTAILDGTNKRLVHLTFSNNFNASNTLTVQNVKDLANNAITAAQNANFNVDATPPSVASVVATSTTQLDITFSENVAQTTAETLTNYSVNNGLGNPASATRDGTNLHVVHLAFSSNFNTSQQNTVSVQNITDFLGNAMAATQAINFSIDATLPSIASVKALSATLVELIFSEEVEQTTAQIANNYTLNGIGNPTLVTQDATNKKLVHLTLGTSLTDLTNYTMTVQNVRDLFGNAASNAAGMFQYLAPYSPKNRDIVINEIFADFTPQVGLPNAEFVELYNTTNRPIDITGWKLSGANTSGFPSFVLRPGGFVILTAPTNVGLFSGNVLSWGGNGSLTNSGETLILTDASNKEVDRVSYVTDWYKDPDKDGGGYSLEQINPTTTCTGINNWQASKSASGGTPGAQNSVFDTTPDQIAPRINLASLKNDSMLVIQFNETMDSIKLQALTNYSIDNGLTVKSVKAIAPSYTVVEILFNGTLQTGSVYNISTSNLTDCIGNTLSNQSSRFGKGSTPAYHELIITELMADPTPGIGLPEQEFIEIFNRSNKILEVKNLQLADASGTAILSALTIFPREYVILVANSSVNDFSSFGKTLGVSNFPSLANNGELLTLRNASGKLLHSVRYSDTWYQNDTKKNGGYTLEIVDTDNPCGEMGNWKAATSNAGGTPGQENSVKTINPDQDAPQLLKAEALTADTIVITFNEKMDSTSLATATYTVNNGVSIQNAQLISPDFKQMRLKVTPKLQTKTIYTLTITNASDCSGNSIAANNTFSFALAEQGDSLDIVLNEVLFNPRTGGVDFVEIYNNSDKYINLKDWQLANIDEDGKIASQKKLTNNNEVLPPKYYRVLTTDQANIQMNYPKSPDSTFLVMPSLPGYSDAAGSVVLINNHGKTMERFDYNADFHFSLIDDKNGVSLERVSFIAPTNNQNSWHSAASTVGFATPGYANSQKSGTNSGGENITLDYSAITPNGDGDRDFVTINYKFVQSGVTVNMTIYDQRGRKITTLAQNDLAATEGFYTWDGTNDAGQKVRIGYYIIYVETFQLNGVKQRFKKPIVVGARF